MTLRGKFIPKNLSAYCLAFIWAVIFTFCCVSEGYGQQNITKRSIGNADSASRIFNSIDSPSLVTMSPDTVVSAIQTPDSSFIADDEDSTVADSLKSAGLEQRLGIRISKDALASVVTADASDSSVLDAHSNNVYLYGDVKVSYEDMQLNAGKVTYSQNTNQVVAEPTFDSTGRMVGHPSFAQGSEKFTYDSLQYNFKSKRAKALNVRSQYGEGFVASRQIKRNPDQSIYGLHNVYTTCSLDTPHFGIVARKIKVIPDRVIASGPADFEIEGVPTPLVLPFGLFPISARQKSGFILPTYTVEENRGLGLLNGGYYFYLNDYVDLTLQTQVYSKGSYSATVLTNYVNKYHYKGAFGFVYSYNKTGEVYEPGAQQTKDYRINWRHSTDEKSRPGQSFNASVDIVTQHFNQNNTLDPARLTQNQYQSNITYNKSWLNKPISLTVAATHNQNTANRQVNVTLPQITFYLNQINPFMSKKAVGASHWYDKISTGYTMNALNRITFYDTAFKLNTLSTNDFTNGISHRIPVSASYNMLRYITTTFNANYDEYWYTEEMRRNYNDATGGIDTSRGRGFYSSRDFNAGVTLTTRIFGMKLFKKGKLRGIRHTLTPTVSFLYSPDFRKSPFNYYYQARTDSTQRLSYLFPYESGAVLLGGQPPASKQGTISYGLGNNLQIKVRSSKDTVTGFKNVTLIDAFSINSSYNTAADSFNWGGIAMNFRTNILNKLNVSANANFSPYMRNPQTGAIMNKTVWSAGQGIARFDNANVSLDASFASKPKKNNSTVKTDEYKEVTRGAVYGDYLDFNIPWNFGVSYTLRVDNQFSQYSKRDTIVLTHSTLFHGDFNLTERWKVTFTSGYDFNQKKLQLTTIGLFRDLHCWVIELSTIPFGPNKNYNFTLRAKAGVLQDLKLTKRRDFRDAALQ